MASKLILKFKDSVISECPLDREETTIGRRPENTIHIDNLAVSGIHARVLKIGNKTILEDLNSTNGTLVDGKRITKSILKNGDQITIGKHTLVYVEIPDAVQEATPPREKEQQIDKTMIISPQQRAAMMPEGSTPAQKSAAMPLAAIQIISGPMAGRKFDLTASLTSMGKGDQCKIKVKGMMVGKQAAVITRRPTGYHIAHLEGITKPKVNGETVGEQPRTLNDGDVIELGDTKMEFYIKP